MVGHPSKMQDREELYRLYWTEKKSLREIGLIYGVKEARVCKWLKRLSIPSRPWTTKGLKFPGRSISDEVKEKLRRFHTGKKLSLETRLKISKNGKRRYGAENNFWKGGRFYQEDGYVFVYAPDSKLPTKRKHKLEHRYVMEKFLERPLTRDEHIHHINGVKSDNRIENLLLVSNREHAEIEWINNPYKRKQQSIKMKKTRASKFWSTSKSS